jgi:hypothetical protein
MAIKDLYLHLGILYPTHTLEAEKAMARIRSPNYPQISLAEAVRRIQQIRAKEGRNAASRAVLAKLIGFSGLNGASMGVLSAISKYGLLEDAGDKELKVSDLADAILFPHDQGEKAAALAEAANKPILFAEINEKWPDHPPSDENLQSYLMRRGFSQGALDNAIACYRETMTLVTSGGTGYDPGADQVIKKAPLPMSDPIRSPAAPRRRAFVEGNTGVFTPPLPTPSASVTQPFRVSFTPSGINTPSEVEVIGRLTSAERADELISALEALKSLLRRHDPKPPLADNPKTPEAPEAPSQISLMITREQKMMLQELGYNEDQIRDMKPEDAHRALGLIS